MRADDGKVWMSSMMKRLLEGFELDLTLLK
jgi:hypothetical protein